MRWLVILVLASIGLAVGRGSAFAASVCEVQKTQPPVASVSGVLESIRPSSEPFGQFVLLVRDPKPAVGCEKGTLGDAIEVFANDFAGCAPGMTISVEGEGRLRPVLFAFIYAVVDPSLTCE